MLTSNDLPSLEECCRFQLHRFHEFGQEDWQLQYQISDCPRDEGDLDNWESGVYRLAFDLQEMLDLSKTSDLVYWRFVKLYG